MAVKTAATETSAHKPGLESSEIAAASLTISGCLERNDATFRLTDTGGTDAPKARSWKSAFLKKRPAPIDLVDQTNTLNLSAHVGERVSATGPFVNGEMRARSLQSIGRSCR
jgi:hypothetical protein